ncbi:MAG: cytochrome ubiquinol oxidase subunit I [Deltaproteobacteria bacterium]|nr:cytochrome ubiquinol oxidase subunit I [Deltaproteobacteria bacterium]
MDALLLSRLQFAVTTFFHFLFVPLTLGLSVLIAWMETRYVRTGDDEYLRMTKFWGKLFIINFVIGVVTGITLEFQFGTNWARYSRYVGDIFGPLLAIEATAAFFLESVFIAVWIFGWKRLSPKAHAAVMWLVAFASTLSAFWILVANSWMQHPVGYVIQNGRAELTDFAAVVFQSYSILTFLHTTAAAYVLSGFFVMGVSAWHLLRKTHVSLFARSFRTGLIFALFFTLFVVAEGHLHGADLAEKQPAKLAALESLWETQAYAPFSLVTVPRPDNEGNLIEVGKIPGVMSLLAYHRTDAVVTGLNDIPKELRPPVLPVFLSFRFMVMMGGLFILLTLWGFLIRKNIEENRLYLRIMLLAVPLPYLVCLAGWTVTEMGRQPWIVYNIMKTSDAVSAVPASFVASSLAAFIVVYTLLGLGAFTMMARIILKGPAPPQRPGKGVSGHA